MTTKNNKGEPWGMSPLPSVNHIYQNHTMDSTYWNDFKPRADDIIIATTGKSGTTWIQTIVAHLIFQNQEIPAPIWQLSPWIDFRPAMIKKQFDLIEAQTHRRFVKTHLPLDGLIYYPQVKYIYIARDGRDIFMSLWNHYRHLTPEMFDIFNNTPGRVGDPLTRPSDDIHEFFKDFMTKGWFSGLGEGNLGLSILNNVQTWWAYRHLPNILLMHFNDLLGDIDRQIRLIARYLDIEVNEDIWPTLLDNASFKSMKNNADNIVPGGGKAFFGGSQRFLYRGTNNRWKGVLSEDEIVLYETTVSEILPPDCARWLEQGQAALVHQEVYH
ncbi:MAG: sulfotransferase domain-containing protein [Spirochaetales bacterium]|nr:sulfotransferase domain-containing protein [Spirochaetales bacterium]